MGSLRASGVDPQARWGLAAAFGVGLLVLSLLEPFRADVWSEPPAASERWRVPLCLLPGLGVAVAAVLTRAVRWPAAWAFGAAFASLVAICQWRSSEGLSVVQAMSEPTARWWLLALYLTPLLAGAAMPLVVPRATRQFAVGVLVGTGVGGYLLHLWVFTLAGLDPPPGRGAVLGLLAAALLTVLGLLPWQAEVRESAHRAFDDVRVTAGVGAVALAAVVLAGPVIGFAAALGLPDVPDALQEPLFELDTVSDRWRAALLVGLTAMAAFAASGPRRLDPGRAAGLLTAAGTLTAAAFVGNSHLVRLLGVKPGPENGYEPSIWGNLTVTMGLVMLSAGLWALLAAVRQGAPDAPDATDATAAVLPDRSRPEAGSQATRYLCAAPHLDSRFARNAVRKVFDEEHRAVAPSFGVDLVTVLRHCLLARRRQRVRDTLLLLLIIPVVPAQALLGTRPVLRHAALLLLLAWGVVAGERWLSRHRTAARHLTRDRFRLDHPVMLTPAQERRLAELRDSEDGNVSVYSGFNPFVGSGWGQGGWSFALSTAKGRPTLGDPQHRLEPLPFTTDELYDAIQRDLAALGLTGLAFEDRLYVDGRAIRDDRRFVPPELRRPVPRVEDDLLDRVRSSPELLNRVYRCLRVHGWQGEFVLSVFLTFACSGSGLFAEVRYFLLAPVRDKHMAVDRLDPDSARRPPGIALAALPVTALLLLLSVPRLAEEAFFAVRRWYRTLWSRRQITTNPTFNFGATTSVRELAQSDRLRRYFQQFDRDMTKKLIERRILDTVIAFLDEHNIDTGELEERQTAILNNGLIISGGRLEAESIAVGTNARSLLSKITNQARPSDARKETPR